MRIKPLLLLLPFLLLASSQAGAQPSGHEKEKLVIPNTHNYKPYIWNVLKNPKDYELILQYDDTAAGTETAFSMEFRSKEVSKIDDLRIFITDEDLHIYRHIRPVVTGGGKYTFNFKVPQAGKYKVEAVFKTQKGWVNISREIKIKGDKKASEPDTKPGDEDYSIKARVIPQRKYTEHVVTILYEIMHKGAPLKGLEKIDGFDMHVASWDEDLKEFIYATPRQNFGGPEVAISMVFMRAGKRAVFAEFKHNGVIRRVDLVIDVREEPKEH